MQCTIFLSDLIFTSLTYELRSTFIFEFLSFSKKRLENSGPERPSLNSLVPKPSCIH